MIQLIITHFGHTRDWQYLSEHFTFEAPQQHMLCGSQPSSVSADGKGDGEGAVVEEGS